MSANSNGTRASSVRMNEIFSVRSKLVKYLQARLIVPTRGLRLRKESVDYDSLIEDLKIAKINLNDDSKFTNAITKEINRILYTSVKQ